MMHLYDYYRSSACFRVRIALNFKEIEYDQIPINLVKDLHLREEYRAMNPQGLVPTLEDPATKSLFTQSLAIIEYLDEVHREPPLLPLDVNARAKARALAYTVACDIHPLNNLRVLKFLTGNFQLSENQKMQWYHHWITQGFDAIETYLANEHRNGPYCMGKLLTIADVCLIPQVYNAQRFEFSLSNYPMIQQVNEHCMEHPAFVKALPDNNAPETIG